MIHIPCRSCGYGLEVPQELAGTAIQCPHCLLLSDIPTINELKQFTEDGMYVLDSALATDDPDRLLKLVYAYSPSKLDDYGNEIDLRGPSADEEDSYKMADDPKADLRPKYDPETGELIRPLEMKHDPTREPKVDPASIPLAKAAIEYAGPNTQRVARTGSIFINLGRPINLLVMVVVFLLHAFVGVLLLLCGWMHYILAVPLLFGVQLMLIAHWANVIDEVGREERDELPRPFRDVQLYDDLWMPFCAIVVSLFLCYAPEQIVAMIVHNPKIYIAINLPLGLLSTYLFPAVFLTASSSGMLLNLRPDRVWGTARAGGSAYAIAVLMWTLAAGTYGFYLLLMLYAPLGAWGMFPTWATRPFFVLPLLAVGIYLMHYFCWTLGLIYRENHAQFPWAFQFHQSVRPRAVLPPRTRSPFNRPKMQIARTAPQVVKPISAPQDPNTERAAELSDWLNGDA